MSNLKEKLKAVEMDAAGEALAQRLGSVNDIEARNALIELGGFLAIDRLTNTLTAEMMRRLIQWQEEKKYLALGYSNFVEFLNESDVSPMTKSKFYDLKALLEKEGDPIFDLFSRWGITQKTRKLLGKGTVEVEGDEVVIHNDDEDLHIELSDRTRILETLSALADANAEKSIKIQRQKEKLDKHDDKVRELYAELDATKAAKIAEVASNPHMIARVELGLAFTRLTDAADKMSAIEKDQFRDQVLQDVALWHKDLAKAYATDRTQKSKPIEIKGDDFGGALDTFLDSVDLDVVADNDGELAAQL